MLPHSSIDFPHLTFCSRSPGFESRRSCFHDCNSFFDVPKFSFEPFISLLERLQPSGQVDPSDKPIPYGPNGHSVALVDLHGVAAARPFTNFALQVMDWKLYVDAVTCTVLAPLSSHRSGPPTDPTKCCWHPCALWTQDSARQHRRR